MTLNIDLEDVPDAILEAVMARILRNRQKLQDNQQQIQRPLLQPKPQVRNQGADNRTWKKPEPAATLQPSGTGWLLVPSGPPDGLSLRCITSFPNKLLSAKTGSESLGRLLNGGLAPVISLGEGQEYTSTAEGYADLSSSTNVSSYNIDESQIQVSNGIATFTFPFPALATSYPAAKLRSYTFECLIKLGVDADAPRPSVLEPSTLRGFWSTTVPSPPAASLDGLVYVPFSPPLGGQVFEPGTTVTIPCGGSVGGFPDCSGWDGEIRWYFYGPNDNGVISLYSFGFSSTTEGGSPGPGLTYTPSQTVDGPNYYSWAASGTANVGLALIANGEILQGAAFNAGVGIGNDYLDGTFSEYISCNAGIISSASEDSPSPLSIDAALLQKNQKSHFAAVKTSEAFNFYFNGQNVGSILGAEELDPASSYQIAVSVSSQIFQFGGEPDFNSKYNTMTPYVMPVSGIRFTPGRALYTGESFTPPTSITRLA